LVVPAVNQTADKAYYFFDGYAHFAAGLVSCTALHPLCWLQSERAAAGQWMTGWRAIRHGLRPTHPLSSCSLTWL
jgi:hypothetical protein